MASEGSSNNSNTSPTIMVVIKDGTRWMPVSFPFYKDESLKLIKGSTLRSGLCMSWIISLCTDSC